MIKCSVQEGCGEDGDKYKTKGTKEKAFEKTLLYEYYHFA